MSAYVVNKDHIDLLVSAAIDADHGGLTWYPVDNLRGLTSSDMRNLKREAKHENADEIGSMLIAANLESVRYRYPEDEDEDLPGPVTHYWTEPYTWEPVVPILYNDADIVMAVRGYDYQACECPRWPVSEARLFCDALLRHYAGKLSENSDAWDWNRPVGRSVVRII